MAYGMVPEDLLFWIVAINESPAGEPSLLCLRHADDGGATRLDTRRPARELPTLVQSSNAAAQSCRPKSKGRRARTTDVAQPEQMQIDGTAEIERPVVPESAPDPEPWQPAFDDGDDLDGLLHVDSPLLARAFRGTDRPKH